MSHDGMSLIGESASVHRDFGGRETDSGLMVMSKDEAIDFARQHGATVWEGRAVLEKFHGDEAYEIGATPFETIESGPNLLTTVGAGLLWSLLCGAGGTAFNSTNARIGVGDSTTAAAAGQTDLQAATNLFKKVVSGAPTLSTNQAVFAATFATGEANFAWNEWSIFNSATANTGMLNRVVASLGTKTSAASWTLTATLTLA